VHRGGALRSRERPRGEAQDEAHPI
jgi:hypothetical protein